ncbi:hypothetical protein GQ55_7G013400 [Panicum hallii var. hallii]|uniref:Uncharacterized protein n=1 Tax=Panicum hallii var. hallii TaxID=1504633 RepID=A0A2T7CRR6_9POAL|nr:hypothetical protein GQ55_7G013400 [Panicum hallii var. hallii]
MMAQQRRSTMGPVMGVTRLTGYSPGVPPPATASCTDAPRGSSPIIFLHGIWWCTCSSTALVWVSFDLLLLLMDRISQMKLRRLCDEVVSAARTGRKEKPHNHSQIPDLNP